MYELTIFYFDSDGDVCSIPCLNRKDAMQTALHMKSLDIMPLGWAFTSETNTEKDYETYSMEELVAN